MGLSRIFENIRPELSEEHRAKACTYAHAVGVHLESQSPYFKDEPLLLKAYHEGIEEDRNFEEQMRRQAEIFYAEMGPPIVWSGSWLSSDDGTYETKPYVVEDDEGYCGGLFVSQQGGDPGMPTGGEPHATLELAIKAAYKLRHEYYAEEAKAIEAFHQRESLSP